MDFELRSVLLIIGVVVIAAILIHGLVGIRRANRPVDISHIDLKEIDDSGDFIRDGSGFDRHGVGKVRKRDSEDVAEQEQESPLSIPDPEIQLDLPLGEDAKENADQGINFSVALEEPELCAVGNAELPVEAASVSVFDSPIAQQKEDYLEPRVGVMEAPSNYDVSENEQDVPSTKPPLPEPMDVLVLNVIGQDDEELSGAVLLPTLLTLGLKFGDMDIFHRHEKSNGRGDVLFSLVNMVKPGTFDIDNMEQFTTTGVSLFMTIPHPQGNMETFNMMLNAAAKIAEAFDGQVLDGDRSTLTNQSTQHYVQRIREVERKMLLVK